MDISFWHVYNGGSPNYFSAADSAGLRIWLNANARAQSFSVSVDCVWEIAGEGYQTVGSPPALVSGSAERGKIISTLLLSNPNDSKHASALYRGVNSALEVFKKYGASKAMSTLEKYLPKDLVLEVASVIGISI